MVLTPDSKWVFFNKPFLLLYIILFDVYNNNNNNNNNNLFNYVLV